MRRTFVIGVILLGISHVSCVHVYFKDPQTLEGVQFSEIPDELQGTWLGIEDGDKEGVTFDMNGIDAIKIFQDPETGMIDTLHRRTDLSDSLRLYRSGKFYLVNSRENSEYWEVKVLRVRHGDIYIYDSRDPNLYLKDRKLRLEEVSYSQIESDEDLIMKTMIEETSDTLQLQSALFSGQMSSKTVRRVVNKRNLELIMREDGSFWSRTDEE